MDYEGSPIAINAEIPILKYVKDGRKRGVMAVLKATSANNSSKEYVQQ